MQINEEFMSVTDELIERFQREVESLETEIPADASPELIKDLLGKLPAEIEYWSRRAVELKGQINNLRVVISGKNDFLNREKSRIRQEKLKSHKDEMEEYFKMIKEIFQDVINTENKVTKATLSEVVKTMRPEKPTKADLDDMANIETASLQEEIMSLEERKNKLEVYYDLLNARVKKVDNKLKVTIAHKGILVEEMKRL